jgi:hypothetical protein
MKWKETNKIATMKYITVLDFEVGRIFQYEIGEEPHRNEDGVIDHEEFLANEGHRMKDCEWMVHDIKEIVDHTIKSTIK